ncbi:MAG: NlpC/P60 family protein [Actinobacteria bacterium]|nr:MAG: NlpC/P60 family protein [Actinomycetota bacterium]
MTSVVPVSEGLWSRAAAVLGAVVLALAPGVPAAADPTPGQVESQINDAWNALEPIVEQYDRVHAQLLATQARIDALRRRIQPLQMQVDLAMARVGAMSARLYETGPGSRLAALLNSGSADTVVDQMTTLDELARRRTAEVAGVAVLRDRYLAEKAPLDALTAQLAVQDAELAARKRVIETRLAQLQQLRLAAYGTARGALRPVPCPLEYLGDRGSIVAKKACDAIGKPYIWAAAGPNGYDCSGLALAAWGSVGVTLGHYTGWQWLAGTPVTRDELRPGDLVFYFRDLHHVAIYVGGDWVVHAPHPGDVVRMTHIDAMPIAGYRRPG